VKGRSGLRITLTSLSENLLLKRLNSSLECPKNPVSRRHCADDFPSLLPQIRKQFNDLSVTSFQPVMCSVWQQVMYPILVPKPLHDSIFPSLHKPSPSCPTENRTYAPVALRISSSDIPISNGSVFPDLTVMVRPPALKVRRVFSEMVPVRFNSSRAFCNKRVCPGLFRR